MKKIITALLSFALAFSTCAVPAFAEFKPDIEIYSMELYGANDITVFSDTSDVFTEAQAKIINNAFKKAVESRSDSIDVSKAVISGDYAYDVYSMITNIIYDTPEYYYVTLTGEVYGKPAGGGYTITTLGVAYRYTEREERAMTARIESDAAAILREMNYYGAKTDFEKILWLHDYIVTNIEYDVEGFNAEMSGTGEAKRYLDEAFVYKKVVCQGYATFYQYLLRKAGIECINAFHAGNGESGHEWSIVKLDGEWYHVDTTQDDPIMDRAGNAMHTYFLVTDAELQAIDAASGSTDHADWYTTEYDVSVSANNTYSNAAWRTYNVSSPIAFVNGSKYFAVYDGTVRRSKIYKCSGNVENPELFYTFDNNVKWWSVADNEKFYPQYYGGLGSYGRYLYLCTTDKLARIDTTAASPTLETVLEYDGSGLLYGSYVSGGTLYYGEGKFEQAAGGGTYIYTDSSEIMSYTLADDTPKTHAVTLMDDNTVVNTVTVNDGDRLSIPAYGKAGYVFDSWYTDSAFTEKWTLSNPVTSDMTLYASFTKISITADTNLVKENNSVKGSVRAQFANDLTIDNATFYLAVYNDGVLVKALINDSGVFDNIDISLPDDSGRCTYKVFAWYPTLTPVSECIGADL